MNHRVRSCVLVLAALLGCSNKEEGAPVAGALPDGLPPLFVESDFESEPETGLIMSRTRVLVLLAESATGADVDSALAAVGAGAKVAGGWADARVVLIALEDSAGLGAIEAAATALRALPFVTAAAPDVLLFPSSLPDRRDESPSVMGPDTQRQANLDRGRCGTALPLDWSWTADTSSPGSNWGQLWANFPAAWNWNDSITKRWTRPWT